MPQQDYLDLIKKYESDGQNVTNYNYGQLTPEGKKQTAQGYYQITDTNWNNIAPKVGIDLTAFPSAIFASEANQRKVANYLLTQTPEGISHWADFNPRLKSALSDTGLRTVGQVPDYQDSGMPQEPDQVPDQGEDLSKISTEELMKRVKGQDPDMAKRLQDQFDALKPKGTPKTQAEPQVKAPPKTSDKGFLRRYAESTPAPWEDPLTLGGGSTARAAIRAFLPGEESASQRISDVGKASSGLAETAAQLYPLGVGRMASKLEELPSLLQSGKSLVGGLIGGFGGQKVGEALDLPPEVSESLGLVGGVAGGGIGGSLRRPDLTNLIQNPRARAAVGIISPRAGKILDFAIPQETPKAAAPTPTATPAPKVTPPPEGPSTQIFPTKPPSPAQLIQQYRSGAIDKNRFMELAATRTGSIQQAAEELTHAEKVIAEEKAKEVERLARSTGGPTIVPVPNVGGTTSPQATQNLPQVNPPPSGAAPTSTNPMPEVQVRVPPGLTIKTTGNLPPVNIPPGGPQTSTNPVPVQPPLRPQGIPSPGLNLPVGPIQPRTPLAGPAPTSTPIGPMLTPSPEPIAQPTPVEKAPALKTTHSDEIANAARGKGKTAEDLRKIKTKDERDKLSQEIGVTVKSQAAVNKAADKLVATEKVPGSNPEEFTSKTSGEGKTVITRTAARGNLPVLTPEQQRMMALIKSQMKK